MQALLDTHTLVWWLDGEGRLSERAGAAIADEDTRVFVSAVSAWELAIKAKIGKFKSRELAHHLDRQIAEEGFIELPISIEHALRAGALEGSHKDPFDRMLIAQAQAERLTIISADKTFDAYEVDRLW